LFGGVEHYKLVIDMPRCASAEEVKQPQFDREGFLLVNAFYQLRFAWPKPIDESNVLCKFVKSKRRLQVFVPLLKD